MEIRDYFTILRRRWATISVVFVCLMGIFTVYLVANERAMYSSTSRLGVLAQRRAYNAIEREALNLAQTGYSYYTREKLIGSKHVLDTAAVIYLAAKDADLGTPSEEQAFWRDDSQENGLVALIQAANLAKVKEEGGRIVSLVPDQAKIAGVSSLFSLVQVTKPDEKVQLLSLTAQSILPEEAKLLVNSLAKGAVIYSRGQALQEYNTLVDNVTSRIAEIQKSKSSKGMSQTSLSFVEDAQKSLQIDISHLEKELSRLQIRKEQITAKRQSLLASEHLDFTPFASVPDNEGLTSPVLEQLRGDIVSLNVSTATKTFALREQHPQLQKMRAQLDELRAQYARELDRVRSVELRNLSQEERDVNAQIYKLTDEKKNKVINLGPVRETVATLSHLEGDEKRYLDIQSELTMQKSRQRGFYVFEDVAGNSAPAPHQWPRSIGMFALVSLILAVAGAFLVEYADTNLRTDYDIRRYVNIPCISLFEEVKAGSPFILRGSPKDPASENFNMAASIVRTYLTERNFKTLAICSAIPKEGKTTIACNVAVAMARKGLRVVVVDADLRIPQIHEIFSVSNGRGLSSLLKGEIEIENLDDALIQTDLETLCVLPSGPVPEGPNTLLESQKMVDLVNTLRARFDVVVFDTPPITSVGDTLTLARIMDTNLLVVAAGLSDRRSVIWAKQMLTSVRGEICGGVLNFVKRRQVSAYYYYYSYYHSSSGSKKSKSLRGKD